MLSHAYWQRRFNRDPSVIGRSFTLSVRGFHSGRFRIVGVGQKGFSGAEPGAPAEVWLPLATRFGGALVHRSDSPSFQILGRLHPDTTPEKLKAMLGGNLQVRPATNGPTYLRDRFARPLWILGAIVGIVVLIACANVANLFAARQAANQREMSLRSSLGASRFRLLQQKLIERGL